MGVTDVKKAAGRLVSALVDRVAKPGRCCFSDEPSIGPAWGGRQAGQCLHRATRRPRRSSQPSREGGARGAFCAMNAGPRPRTTEARTRPGDLGAGALLRHSGQARERGQTGERVFRPFRLIEQRVGTTSTCRKPRPAWLSGFCSECSDCSGLFYCPRGFRGLL